MSLKGPLLLKHSLSSLESWVRDYLPSISLGNLLEIFAYFSLVFSLKQCRDNSDYNYLSNLGEDRMSKSQKQNFKLFLRLFVSQVTHMVGYAAMVVPLVKYEVTVSNPSKSKTGLLPVKQVGYPSSLPPLLRSSHLVLPSAQENTSLLKTLHHVFPHLTLVMQIFSSHLPTPAYHFIHSAPSDVPQEPSGHSCHGSSRLTAHLCLSLLFYKANAPVSPPTL